MDQKIHSRHRQWRILLQAEGHCHSQPNPKYHHWQQFFTSVAYGSLLQDMWAQTEQQHRTRASRGDTLEHLLHGVYALTMPL